MISTLGIEQPLHRICCSASSLCTRPFAELPRLSQGRERTLLLVWPTYDEVWSDSAVGRHHESGGIRVTFLGEPPG